MSDKKLTDEEIVKVLECCAYSDGCERCQYSKQCDGAEHLINTLDLINRQKSEIERLKGSTVVNNIMESQRIKREAKANAYKEFAERIKMSIKANVVETLRNDVKGVYNAEYVLDDIDNLLKEMVGN